MIVWAIPGWVFVLRDFILCHVLGIHRLHEKVKINSLVGK